MSLVCQIDITEIISCPLTCAADTRKWHSCCFYLMFLCVVFWAELQCSFKAVFGLIAVVFKRPQQECDHVPADSQGSSALEQLLLRFWTFYCVNIPALWLDDAWEMLWDSYQLYTYFSSCSSPSVLLYTPCHVFLIHASHSLSLYNFPWSCSVFPHPCLFQKFGLVRFINGFERSLFCSPRLYLFDQKYSKTVILWKTITV